MVAADREANPSAREKAIRAGFEQTQSGEIDRKDWRERTKSIAWLASNPAPRRPFALEMLLKDDPEVETASEGTEPNRCVVVVPVRPAD